MSASVDSIAVAVRAQTALRFAREEAKQRGSAAVTTEHILLGVLDDGAGRVGPGVATSALAQLGVEKDALRRDVDALIEPSNTEVVDALPYSVDAAALLNAATAEARALHHSWVGTEHFLLGILRGNSGAARALVAHGLTVDSVRSTIVQLLGT